jgi:hypothetical protein
MAAQKRKAPLRAREYRALVDKDGNPPPPPAKAAVMLQKAATGFSGVWGLYVPTPASAAAVGTYLGVFGDMSGCQGPVDGLLGDLTVVSGYLGHVTGNVRKAWPARPKKRVRLPGAIPDGTPHWEEVPVFAPTTGAFESIQGDIGDSKAPAMAAAGQSVDLGGLGKVLEFASKVGILPMDPGIPESVYPKTGGGLVYGSVSSIKGDVTGLEGYVGAISGDVGKVWGKIANCQFPWPAMLRDPDSPPEMFNSAAAGASASDIEAWGKSADASLFPFNSQDFCLVGAVSGITGCLGTESMAGALDAAIKKYFDSGKKDVDFDGIFRDLKCIWGNASNITGNVSRIHGYVGGLKGDVSGLVGCVSNLRGDATGLRGIADQTLAGDVTAIHGDITGLMGDISGLTGDVSNVGMKNAGLVEGRAGQIPFGSVVDGALNFVASLIPSVPISPFKTRDGDGKTAGAGTDASSLDGAANPWLSLPPEAVPPGMPLPKAAQEDRTGARLAALLTEHYPPS